MACRPAGMSDEDSSDEDAYLPVPHGNSKNQSSKRWSARTNANGGGDSPAVVKTASRIDESARQEEQELQFRALRACMTGNVEIINEYVKAGRDVNDFLYTGWTLLLYAASSVLPEVIELLINLGASPNKSKDGFTPLMVLCDSNKGTEEQCLRCFAILVKAKANPNAHNKVMKTPLMFACQTRETAVVEELLKHVKNIDATDSDGRTALHYAAAANKPEIVKLLLKNNATSTITDRSNLTAKDIAETKNYEKIVAILDKNDDCTDDALCVIKELETWKDMFSDDNGDAINRDIVEILYGMGLESYKSSFKGMSLKNFLRLTEDDLVKLGVDIELHRKQFFQHLHKFHTKAWSVRSIGSIKRLLPYTLYDGVTFLGNAARQIGVIGSSFQYVKNGLQRASSRDENLTEVEKTEYSEELKKTEKTLFLLKNDLREILKLAKNAERENRNVVPASYISSGDKKRNWTIIISVMIMTGMYLSKTSFVQRLWNNLTTKN